MARSLLEEVEELVSRGEAALAQNRLPDFAPVSLDHLCQRVYTEKLDALPTAQALAERLWELSRRGAQGNSGTLQNGFASAKELACHLLQASGTPSAEAQSDLFRRWSLAGRAWIEVGSYAPALRCLERAASIEVSDTETLGVFVHTQLWMSTASLHTASYDQALVSISATVTCLRKHAGSPDLWSQLLLKCGELGTFLRERGEPQRALDLMMLASGPGSDQAPALLAAVKRQLALCFLDLEKAEAAEAEAREAMKLELGETAGRAKTLSVLVQVLCARVRERGEDNSNLELANAGEMPAQEELRQISLDLMAEKRATLRDCQEACRCLVGIGFDKLFFKCLLRLRRRDEPNVLATRYEEASAAAQGGSGKEGAAAIKEVVAESLCSWLDEAGKDQNLPESITERLCALLWSLAQALRPQEALTWLHKALPFLGRLGQVSKGWLAIAASYRLLGDSTNARRCVETALSYDSNDPTANMLLLADAAARGQSSVVHGLADRVVKKQLKIGVKEVAFVVSELRHHRITPTHLTCLDLLFDLACQEESSEVSPSRALLMSVEAAAFLGFAPDELAARLRRAGKLVLQDDEKAALCRCADRLTSAAAAAAAWPGCVALLEASLPLSVPAAAADRTVALAKALLKEASANSAKSHELLRRVQGLCVTGGTSDSDSPAAKALAFCQAEAICRLGEEPPWEVIEAAGPQARLRLAQASLQAGHPALASGLLLGYLRQASGDPLQEAAARREVVSLAQRGGSGVEVLQRFCAETLSRQHALKESRDQASSLPTTELLWLATTAWNEGVRLLQSAAEGAAGDDRNAAQTFLSQASRLLDQACQHADATTSCMLQIRLKEMNAQLQKVC